MSREGLVQINFRECEEQSLFFEGSLLVTSDGIVIFNLTSITSAKIYI